MVIDVMSLIAVVVLLSQTNAYTFDARGDLFNNLPSFKSRITRTSSLKNIEARQTKTEKDMEDINTAMTALKQNVSDLQLISENSKNSSADVSALVKKDEFDSMKVTVAALEKALNDLKKKEQLDSGTVSNSDSPSNQGLYNATESCSSICGFVALSPSLCVKVSDQGTDASWEDSRVVCQGFGGDLATFQNEDENQKALDYLKSLGIWEESRYARVWVGYRKVQTNYEWISDSTYGGYWGLYQPKDIDSMACVGLVIDGLSNSVCLLSQRFLCQLPK